MIDQGIALGKRSNPAITLKGLYKKNSTAQRSRNQIPLKKGGKGVVKNLQKKFLRSNSINPL